MTPVELRNLARGGRGFHLNRFAIFRACVAGDYPSAFLSPFLCHRLFGLDGDGWRAYAFVRRDWEIAELLIGSPRPATEQAMVALALEYVRANLESVTQLYAMGDLISGRLLRTEAIEVAPGTDSFTATQTQSLFAFRVIAGTHQSSPQAIRDEFDKSLARGGWCQTRLMHPLINLVTNGRSANELDDFLAYFGTGDEHALETLAVKLLLSDTAARDAPLVFKLFVGLMGHPYDVCEMMLDHVEYASLRPGRFPEALRDAVKVLAEVLPGTRAARVAKSADALKNFSREAPRRHDLQRALSTYSIAQDGPEAELLATYASLDPFSHRHVVETARPLVILANMRASEYPDPAQFRTLAIGKAVWSFTDGGRLCQALMRSIYMVDRTTFDLEARDVLRLASFYGCINPMIASAPSAMALLRRLGPPLDATLVQVEAIERETEAAISARSPLGQRLWINELQWRLRRLEDEGRVQAWLALVRSDAKVRPLYLTGINWPWVEEIITQQRLKPFRSFDGAYLLLLMELEAGSDPLRLNLVLGGLLQEMTFEQVVATLLVQYGDKAPAFLRRYLTTSTLLSTGLASNYFSALDMRLKAIEEGVRTLGFTPLLTRENWEAEARLLTAELLLLNVNSGKFEVPWEAFKRDVVDRHGDLYGAFRDMNAGATEEALSALVDTPKVFKNGRKEQYRYRRSNALLFQVVIEVVEDFLDHPAFGLEIILSGRFRHNVVLQELQAVLADVEGRAIFPVTEPNKHLLIAAYRPVLEKLLYAWCSRRLHTRRDDRPDALFDLVPSSVEMAELLAAGAATNSLEALVALLTDWLREKLRTQVVAAGAAFVSDLRTLLTTAFDEVRDRQIAEAGTVYRTDDARRIHQAVHAALVRRVEELEVWFGGVDTTTPARVTLVQLGYATERLFENVMPGKRLVSEFDLMSPSVEFEPHQVKVAFDLVRELAFNALKHAPAGNVRLEVAALPGDGPLTFQFANAVAPPAENGDGTVTGHRYGSPDEALTRDRNSGRLKVAASAATLVGRDVELRWQVREGRYSAFVPLAGGEPAGR